jgi:type II secretory pathway component PulF
MKSIFSDLSSKVALGPGDAVALAAGIAELTKAGLPLPMGLRALADELPGRRVREGLRLTAARLERGDSLAEILNDAANHLPPYLCALLLAGLRSGRLPEAMEEYLQVEQEQRRLRQSMQGGLIYLSILALSMTVLAFGVEYFIWNEFEPLIRETQRSMLGMYSNIAVKMFDQIVWLSAGFTVFLMMMPISLANFRWMAMLTPLTDRFPFIGPLLQNLRAARFSRVTALMLDMKVPLPDVIRMAGTASGDIYLARDCRKVASELEQGGSLTESLAERWRFPRNLIPLVEWGRQVNDLAESFRMAARWQEGQAKNECLYIRTILTPFLFLLIAGFICLVGSVISMPTIGMVQSLLSMAWWMPRGGIIGLLSIVFPDCFAFSSMFSPLFLGVALLISRRLITLRRDPKNENILELMMRIVGWVLIAVGLCGNLLLMMGALSFFWIPILIVVLMFIANKRRRLLQQSLLWTMAVSAERFIPMAPVVEAFAEDIGGKFGVRVSNLARLLRLGCPLPDALRQIKKVVPKSLLPTIRVGHESGALAQGLADAASAEDKNDAIWGSFSAKMLYIAAFPCLGSVLVFFMLVYILPDYRKIFLDFHVTLPSLTMFMMGFSNWAESCKPLLFVMAVGFGLVFLYGALRYLGVPLFDLPGTSRILRRQHTTAILDTLALGVEHHRPLAGILRVLHESYPKKSIRRRLNDVLFDIEPGAAWQESLFRRGLIRRSDLAVLQSAERTGNLVWALREIAESNRRRLAYRLNVAVQLLFPPIVLSFGAAMLFIAVALFSPLLTLIDKISR